MKTKKLILEQLDNKIIEFKRIKNIEIPTRGWIFSIRQAINMSMRQLGQRLSITPQSVKEIEEREQNDTISLKVLKQFAAVMNMQFVYGFIPKDKTLKSMVETRARELAKQIVERTSIHMTLEDQKNRDERIEVAIKEKTEELTRELPKYLWD